MAAELAESICAFWQARGVFQVTESLFGSPTENHLRGKANSQGGAALIFVNQIVF